MSDAPNNQQTSQDGEPNLLHRHVVRSRSSQSSSNANNNIQSSVDDGGDDLSWMDISTNPNPPSAAVAMSVEQSRSGEKDTGNNNDAHLETIDEQKSASSMENGGLSKELRQPQPRLVRDASVSTEVVTDADVTAAAAGEVDDSKSAGFSPTMPMTTFGERQVSSRTLARRAAEEIGTSNHNNAGATDDHSSAAPAASASTPSVTIHLSSEEEHLFQTLLEAADMYERGELNIEDAADKASFRPLGHGDRADSDMAGVGTSTGSSHHSSDSNHSSNNGNGGQVEIRVAGGWVRDKILNLNSHDVDVALNNICRASSSPPSFRPT